MGDVEGIRRAFEIGVDVKPELVIGVATKLLDQWKEGDKEAWLKSLREDMEKSDDEIAVAMGGVSPEGPLRGIN